MIFNKGVSFISLIVTIIVMIILAAISTPLLSSVINDSLNQDAKAELRNVENVVDYAKAQIMIDKFVPNSEYVISDSDLNYKFGQVLSSDEIQHIKSVNNNPNINVTEKYFLMDQERFDSEFGNGFNVSGIREDREYLVSYIDGLVVANYSGTKITNGNQDSIVPVSEIDRGEVVVRFSPNGNSEWKTKHETSVTVSWKNGTVNNVSYVWSESFSQPSDGLFTNSLGTVTNNSASSPIVLSNETGNGWYLWVKVEYTEDVNSSVPQTKYVRSEAFFVDNIAPTADLAVDEIK